MVIEAIPPNLRFANEVNRFLSWLRGQPLDPEDKRLIFLSWCHHVGIKPTKQLAEAAGIR